MSHPCFRPILLFLAISLAVSSWAHQNAPAPAGQLPPASEESLGEMSRNRTLSNPLVGYSRLPGNRGDDTAAYYCASPHAGGALWMDKTPAGRVVRFNGKAMGEAYDDVQLVTFSADGQHVIFIGKRSRLWHVVVDGQETAQAYKSVDSIYLSPDGQRTVVIAAREDKTYVLVNGQEQPNTYGGVELIMYGVNFVKTRFGIQSPESAPQHIVQRGYSVGKACVLVDGKEDDAASAMTRPLRVAPDGTLSAWVAHPETGPWQIIVDGVVRAESTREITMAAVSYDGRQIVYAARLGAGYVLVSPDGSTSEGLMDSRINHASPLALHFIGRSAHWIASVESVTKRMWHYVVDGVMGPPADVLGDFRSTPDGAHWAYAGGINAALLARVGNPTLFAMLDGREVLRGFAITESGESFATVGMEGLKDLQPEAKDLLYRMNDPQRVVTFASGTFVFEFLEESDLLQKVRRTRSPQGNRYMTSSWKGTTSFTFSIDGGPAVTYRLESFSDFGFSADERHWAGVVVKAKPDKRSFVVLDGLEGKHYDEILPGSISIDSSAGVGFVAREGLRFYRVLQPWSGAGTGKFARR